MAALTIMYDESIEFCGTYSGKASGSEVFDGRKEVNGNLI